MHRLNNRVKSLLWRSSMMAIAVFISLIADNLDVFQLSPVLTTFAGLVLGEISKYLNTK